MRRLVQGGHKVTGYWAHSTDARSAESARVARRIGNSTIFDRFPDRELCHHMAELRTTLAQILRQIQPTHVVAPSFEQGHPDHDTLNWAVRQEWDQDLLEVPLYRPARVLLSVNSFWDGHGEIHPLTPDDLAFKLELCRAYPSQRLGKVLRLHQRVHQLMRAENPLLQREIWRKQPPIDYRFPNAPHHLVNRILRSSDWKRWIFHLNRYENWNSGDAKIIRATAAPT
jgi:LmbE family N-acetylglucosaminyl deacetylase